MSYEWLRRSRGKVVDVAINLSDVHWPWTATRTKDWDQACLLTCIVTIRSSTITSLVRKSAPMVALYWLVNFLLTYWFISDVLPTLESPSMITFSRTFFLVAMIAMRCRWPATNTCHYLRPTEIQFNGLICRQVKHKR